MYPSYDMNPITIEHMRRVRLAADIARVERGTKVQFRLGFTAVAIVVAVAIVI